MAIDGLIGEHAVAADPTVIVAAIVKPITARSTGMCLAPCSSRF
jgi:hypothetical protein